jgi:RNA polymerase sigma-70 factor (ECF subfamily)
MDKPWNVDLTIYPDEAELLTGLRRRDRFACTCLLKRFAPRLDRVAVQLMGSRDEADDVLQEAMIQACARIESFEGRSGLGSWLHRIVVNAALMRLRQRRAAPRSLDAPAAPDAAPLAEVVAGDPALDQHMLTRELSHELDQAIRQLPETLRTAVVLRDIEGLSTREAAEALQIGESALKVRLHRAHAALRQALQPYLADHPADEGDSAHADS